MSESNDGKRIVVPFNKLAMNHMQQNRLQAQMFSELDAAGLLKVKSIGATCTIWQDGKVLARVIYIKLEDATKIANAMLEFFGKNNMVNWAATVDTCELF